MTQLSNINYTAEATELNNKLQIKRIKGLRFRVNSTIVCEMTATYGLYIEGKGFMQWNDNNGPIGGTKKYLEEVYLEYGLCDYKDVHFVNPIAA